MTVAAVHPTVVERFPGYAAVAVVASGVANGPPDDASDVALAEAERRAPDPATHPHVLAWRAAFADLGIKAKQHPSSVEALVRRARGAEGLPRISRLVDVYILLERLEPMSLPALEAAADELTARLLDGWPGAEVKAFRVPELER